MKIEQLAESGLGFLDLILISHPRNSSTETRNKSREVSFANMVLTTMASMRMSEAEDHMIY